MALEQPNRRPFSFPPAFRLKRRRLIRPLFDRSRNDVFSVTSGCIRLLFRITPRSEAGHDVPLQIGFTMGRGIRKAVHRNRIKRVLREAYRRHQHLLIDCFAGSEEAMLSVMVVFRGHPERADLDIPTHLPIAFQRLADKIQEGSMPL